QAREAAGARLVAERLDLMVVVGGYTSSTTTPVAAICQQKVPTYHVEDAACIDPHAGTIRFRSVGAPDEQCREGWLPAGRVTIGITAGASTPNNKIGETIERIAAARGTTLEGVLGG